MATTPTPRVFISYSWTSEDHSEWVANLSERLMADGIDVVLDQWSLKDGQDLHSFMEQMVTDPSIKRVIIISDCAYASKADGRKGGVGTESQIISKEVYDKVDQEKFIPVLREHNEDGKPCLPVFLRSRKYIAFSDPDAEAAGYDQLLRNIYERPVRRKPALGNSPAHIFDESAVSVTSAQRAKRFLDFLNSGRGNPAAAFADFGQEFLDNLEELRLIYSKDQESTWCKTLFDNIERARLHRDIFVNVVAAGIKHVQEGWFFDALIELLERVLPITSRPNDSGAFYRCSEDNFKFLVYELFLYALASCVQSRKYQLGRALKDYRYVAPETLHGQRIESHGLSAFNCHTDSLDGQCADRGNVKRLSVMADLVHDRANRKDIHFRDLLQADVIACIASSKMGGYAGWYPRCTVYAGEVGKLELFLRAATKQGFEPLRFLLQFNDGAELLRHLSSDAMQRIWAGDRLWRSCDPRTMFNLEELNRAWHVTA